MPSRPRIGIPASKVLIRRRYLVDCEKCGEAADAETASGCGTRGEAEQIKAAHLRAHELDSLNELLDGPAAGTLTQPQRDRYEARRLELLALTEGES